ncbi:MAG: 4Fe-4S binding protein [Clostridiales Family XIII bacterium]|nr:4Fe-4S binding protein [Clostridiales Family XIII bacterium]
MKKLAVTEAEKCMMCLTCEVACAEAYYKNYGGENLAALRIETKDEAPKVVVCVQCGKCAKACEAEAITADDKGVYRISKDKCVDCGACLEACPFKVMVKAADRKVPSKCIACGLCVRKCPVEILTIKEN